MVDMNLQYFGGRGSGGGKSSGGGGAKLSSEQRAQVVADVEKAVSEMKAPTKTKGAFVQSHGVSASAIKREDGIHVELKDGTDFKEYTRANWKQAKDTIKTKLPSMATAKAEGRRYFN